MYDIASIYSARSVDDAIRALQADPAAVVIAGGTDVLIKIREGKLADSRLVSIHGLREELEGVTLLENGDIDVTNGFTTDAQLSAQDVVVLEDDKHLQVNYFCSTVVREDTLEAYPGLEDALMLMDGILSDTDMSRLNYLVEVEEQDESDVARDYLVEKGILEA